MKIYERLRQLRQEQGLSLRHLAQSVGVAPSYMSDLEKGNRQLNFALLDKICNGLNADSEFRDTVRHGLTIERGELPPELVEVLKDKELYDWLLRGGYQK